MVGWLNCSIVTHEKITINHTKKNPTMQFNQPLRKGLIEANLDRIKNRTYLWVLAIVSELDMRSVVVLLPNPIDNPPMLYWCG